MDEIKLKPCPFCGSDAELIQDEYLGLVIGFVRCKACGARTDYEYGKEFATDLWNGRVQCQPKD